MKRCVVSALLCLAVLFAAFLLDVSAENNVDTPIADIGIYADETVQVGSSFTVEIYVENITAANGVIGNDLPLSYDRDRLTLKSVDCVYPAAWGDKGLFLGKTSFEEYPYYLRSLPDVDDAVDNQTYWVKESKQLGYKVAFSADKTGTAFVAVENDPEGKDLIFLVTGIETDNYTANGARVNINISDGPVESSPDDGSVAESSEASSEEPVSAESSEASSEEPVSAESSEESAESVSAADESTLDAVSSADESTLDAVSSAVESGEVSVGTLSSESSEESHAADNNGGDGPKPAVIIAVVAAAVAAIALALVFVFVAKKKKQS